MTTETDLPEAKLREIAVVVGAVRSLFARLWRALRHAFTHPTREEIDAATDRFWDV